LTLKGLGFVAGDVPESLQAGNATTKANRRRERVFFKGVLDEDDR
jgi:hypothetical protein